MVSANIPAIQIKGRVPALDNRQLTQISLLTAQNIAIDAEGPYSGFGTFRLTQTKFVDPDRIQSFRVGTNVFHFVTGAVLVYDKTSDSFIPIFTMSSDTETFPWSHALVGGLHYFSKEGMGLIQYNPITVTWTVLTSDVPAGALAVTQSAGRLIVLGTSLVAWSAISDGADLATSTVTGAGAQALSLVNEGAPLGVYQTDDGFITYTTGGLMKSEAIDSINPFRHYALSNQIHTPLSPYCIVVIADQETVNRHIILARTGLWQTAGRVPVVWEPLMSEFFTRTYLPTLGSAAIADIGATIRITYLPDWNWLAISLSGSGSPFDYTEAWVLYIPKSGEGDGWGHFDELHAGFIEFYSSEGVHTGFNWTYIGLNGDVNLLSHTPTRETDPDYETVKGIHYRLPYEIPARYSGTTVLFATVGKMRAYNFTVYPVVPGDYFLNQGTNADTRVSPDPVSATQQASVEGATTAFKTNAAMGAGLICIVPKLMARVFNSVNASMQIGLYRLTEQQLPDELSLINDITMGVPAAPMLLIIEDLETTSLPDEDLEAASGAEDLEEGALQLSIFDTTIIGTLDGKNVWQSQTEALTLVQDINDFKHFTCSNTGLYHIIQLDALDIDESFYLKTLEVSGNLAGRL